MRNLSKKEFIFLFIRNKGKLKPSRAKAFHWKQFSTIWLWNNRFTLEDDGHPISDWLNIKLGFIKKENL